LLLATVIVGVVGWLHYQPVRLDGYMFGAPDGNAYRDVEFGQGTVIDHREGTRVLLAFTVDNRGRVPISLSRPEPLCGACVLKFDDMYVLDEGGGWDLDHSPPPTRGRVRVGAHDRANLGLIYTMRDCAEYERGGAVGIPNLTFDVRVAGVHHRVPLQHPSFPLNIKMHGCE
jgi:hypothetical protein